MADELLLSSTRVSPDVLIRTNFSFRFPELKEAIQNLVEK
jgi:NAD dependent epimerase/dehydratase family enzyme